MNKTFKTIEEVKSAIRGGVWCSNADPSLLEDDEVVNAVAHDFMEYTDGTMRELLPNEDAWGQGNDFERAKMWLGLEDNVVRHIYTWSEDGVANYICFAEDWDYAEEKAESETKEANEAGIPSGRYFRQTYYAGRLTMSFVEYHPTGEEIWSEKPYAVNAFGMGIKKYQVYAHERAKKSFTIFLAETPEQVRFMSK